MAKYYDLGDYWRPIHTANAESEQWFNRGLMWLYGFDLESACKCFARGIDLDPDCAMHYWGLAYSSGCYYNQPWKRMVPDELERKLANAYDASRQALAVLNNATDAEAGLITALESRYQSRKPVDVDAFDKWNDDYANVMRSVYQQFSEDDDVCTLFAESLMCRTPWALWDLNTGDPQQGASTEEALSVLETAIERRQSSGDSPHPGLLHLHIHVLEMSPFPERALPTSDALRTLVPGSGHLCHMPSHIDVRCGHYLAAVVANNKAIDADREYLRREGAMNFHTLSRIHNFHLKIYAAMFLGQYHPALEAANELIETTPEVLLRMPAPAMADWMEGYIGMKAHVYIRFGKWQEIIDTPFPEDQTLYCATTAIWRYAKTVAYAATRQVVLAEAEREEFYKALGNVPESRYLFNNRCTDILKIAAEMLNGEVEYRKENYDIAFNHLRAAIDLEDNLKYDEPWGWMQPVRHALGALLLEQGQVEQALEAYRADLGLDDSLPSTSRHPENLWSLQGYVECLHKLGREDEAIVYEEKLQKARALADVPVSVSCFCRLEH